MMILVPVSEMGMTIQQRKGSGSKIEWCLVVQDSTIPETLEQIDTIRAKLVGFHLATAKQRVEGPNNAP